MIEWMSDGLNKRMNSQLALVWYWTNIRCLHYWCEPTSHLLDAFFHVTCQWFEYGIFSPSYQLFQQDRNDQIHSLYVLEHVRTIVTPRLHHSSANGLRITPQWGRTLLVTFEFPEPRFSHIICFSKCWAVGAGLWASNIVIVCIAHWSCYPSTSFDLRLLDSQVISKWTRTPLWSPLNRQYHGSQYDEFFRPCWGRDTELRASNVVKG